MDYIDGVAKVRRLLASAEEKHEPCVIITPRLRDIAARMERAGEIEVVERGRGSLTIRTPAGAGPTASPESTEAVPPRDAVTAGRMALLRRMRHGGIRSACWFGTTDARMAEMIAEGWVARSEGRCRSSPAQEYCLSLAGRHAVDASYRAEEDAKAEAARNRAARLYVWRGDAVLRQVGSGMVVISAANEPAAWEALKATDYRAWYWLQTGIRYVHSPVDAEFADGDDRDAAFPLAPEVFAPADLPPLVFFGSQ